MSPKESSTDSVPKDVLPVPNVVVREVIHEKVSEVIRPDPAWFKVMLCSIACSVGLFFGSILIHNHQPGAVVTAIVMLVVSSVFSLTRQQV